jgi:AcrR family transcriptional regulator
VKGKTKSLWIYEGFAILEEAGPDQLTIDELCRRLKLTKGSFYYHFKNRQDYIRSLLEFWEEDSTQRIINLSQSEESDREKLDRLTELVTKEQNRSLEVKIRSWATHDEKIRLYQQRVDEQRMNYAKKLCATVYKDNVDSNMLAQIYYTILIGSQHLIPPIKGKELMHIFKTISQHITKYSKMTE